MSKLSAGTTVFFKRVFPVLWFTIVSLVIVLLVIAGAWEQAPVVMLTPLVMAVVGLIIMKKLLWDLMDEVYDHGDFLLIRNNGEEERIHLSHILQINQTILINPPRVTLRLSEPCRFGSTVTFSPAIGLRLNPFAKVPAIEDLIVRAEQARAQ
jgi:hypothetical protein